MSFKSSCLNLPMGEDYESRRLKNIEENRKILAALGIRNALCSHLKVIKKTTRTKKPLKRLPNNSRAVTHKGNPRNLRKSRRLNGLSPSKFKDVDNIDNYDNLDKYSEKEEQSRPRIITKTNVHGSIPGIEIGSIWQTRIECSRAGVHRPTVAGIHGNPINGCYSVALSGGYQDDIDTGDSFTFTGEGGRDLRGTKANPKNLRTAPQSKDQTLSRGNLALIKSVENQYPVRVIRGFKLNSPFAPDEGYRYDGLYKVNKYWYTTGLAGYGVYKFAFVRIKDQLLPPWKIINSGDNKDGLSF